MADAVPIVLLLGDSRCYLVCWQMQSHVRVASVVLLGAVPCKGG